jgi:hypothetical protein
MSDRELPAHLLAFVNDLQSDPVLRQGAAAVVGDLEDAAAAEAAAAYFQSQGFQVTAPELTAFKVFRKQAADEPLSEYELEFVAGGNADFFRQDFYKSH